MNRNDAIDYLTRCADDNGVHWYQGRPWDDVESCPTCHGTNDAGWLNAPCSRYGRTSADIAPLVYRIARIDGDTSEGNLEHWMGLAVNDSDTPQQFLREHAASLAGADVDAMVDGYLECQLWAQSDMGRSGDTGEPMLDTNYDVSDIATDYVESVRNELADLIVEHPLAIRMYLNHHALRHAGRNGQLVLIRETSPAYTNEQFGHDYYLTRERHGAGFWDRGLGELGKYLTDVAHWAGSADDLWDRGDGVLAP